jgi:hypothetical protein
MAFPDLTDVVSLLGRRAKDKITGAAGIITSVSFDLYGCVQATLHTGLDKDGKPAEQYWHDVQRLEPSTEPRVMEPPKFGAKKAAEYDNGPAAKPAPRAV